MVYGLGFVFSFLPCSACFSWLGIADSILGPGNSFVLLFVLVFVLIHAFLKLCEEINRSVFVSGSRCCLVWFVFRGWELLIQFLVLGIHSWCCMCLELMIQFSLRVFIFALFGLFFVVGNC